MKVTDPRAWQPEAVQRAVLALALAILNDEHHGRIPPDVLAALGDADEVELYRVIVGWNDAIGRRHEDVLSVLDSAIAIASRAAKPRADEAQHQTISVLRAARDLLSEPEAWTKDGLEVERPAPSPESDSLPGGAEWARKHLAELDGRDRRRVADAVERRAAGARV